MPNQINFHELKVYTSNRKDERKITSNKKNVKNLEKI